MSMLSTNLDIRAYATARGVKLKDIAKALGIAPSTFTVQYMRTEQRSEVKAKLKAVIREIAEGERDENEEKN